MSEKIDLNTLNDSSYNPRIITDEHLNNLKDSIKNNSELIPNSEGYRLTTTVTINKNGNRIVGGHQRIKALKSLGQDWIDSNDITWVDLIPDSAEEKALNVTLNSERFQGNWDVDKLDKVLKELYYPTLIEEDIEISTSMSHTKLENEEIDAAFKSENGESQFVEFDTRSIKSSKKREVEEQKELESCENENYSTITIDNFTYQQKTDVIKCVQFSKSKYGFKTSSEALSKICEDYLSF